MTEATSHHYIPALGNIYSAVDEYAEPILRIALGAILIPHGMQKLFGAFGGMGLPATPRCSIGSASRPAYSGARWSAVPN
jgi:putative oxidoreductase